MFLCVTVNITLKGVTSLQVNRIAFAVTTIAPFTFHLVLDYSFASSGI